MLILMAAAVAMGAGGSAVTPTTTVATLPALGAGQ